MTTVLVLRDNLLKQVKKSKCKGILILLVRIKPPSIQDA